MPANRSAQRLKIEFSGEVRDSIPGRTNLGRDWRRTGIRPVGHIPLLGATRVYTNVLGGQPIGSSHSRFSSVVRCWTVPREQNQVGGAQGYLRWERP
jgi:hypothetical protein